MAGRFFVPPGSRLQLEQPAGVAELQARARAKKYLLPGGCPGAGPLEQPAEELPPAIAELKKTSRSELDIVEDGEYTFEYQQFPPHLRRSTMKIHSNVIGYTQQLRDALTAEKQAGRIAGHVSFKKLDQRGSRTHKFAFDIQLEADVRDNGRRAGNSGSYGAMRPEYDGFAATFDEWGWFLAALYEIDPAMVVGTGKYATYSSHEDFDEKTGLSYNPEALIPLLEAGHWPSFVGHPDYTGGDPYPYVAGQAGKTKKGYMVGRYGFGRVSIERGENNPSWYTLHPRTPAQVRAHASLPPVVDKRTGALQFAG